MYLITLIAAALAALQPPPFPSQPVAPPVTAQTNQWLNANVRITGGWQAVARNNTGMTLVLWPAKRGDPFNIEIRSERVTPVPVTGSDGKTLQALSWTTTYQGGCRTSRIIGPTVGGVIRETPHRDFNALSSAAYAGQNLTGESISMPTPMTLEQPNVLFTALCREIGKGAIKEAVGPSDLTAPAVQAWIKSTLDLKGWQAPGLDDDGVFLLSTTLPDKGPIRSADVRREYFQPTLFRTGDEGVLALSVLLPVSFDCAAKTAQAQSETTFVLRNLKGEPGRQGVGAEGDARLPLAAAVARLWRYGLRLRIGARLDGCRRARN
jgi:hypothetical protein